MNRFEYAGGGEKAPFEPKLVKFYIPGSGGSIIGIARIETNYPLRPNDYPWDPTREYKHYERIHYNHIDWETKDIRWHGIHLGKVLDHYSPKNAGLWGGPGVEEAYAKEMQGIHALYAKKYPTAQ